MLGYRDAGILGFQFGPDRPCPREVLPVEHGLLDHGTGGRGSLPLCSPAGSPSRSSPPRSSGAAALGPIASSAGPNKIHLGAFPVEATSYFPETIVSMRSILFSPVMLAGGLFLLGVLVSNWRHVIVTAWRTDCRRPRHPRPHRGRSDRQWLRPVQRGSRGAGRFHLGGRGPSPGGSRRACGDLDLQLYQPQPRVPCARVGFVLSVWAVVLLRWINPAPSASPLGPRLRLRPPAESAWRGRRRVDPLAPARGRGCCDSGGGAVPLRVRSGRSGAHLPRCPGWTGWTPLPTGNVLLVRRPHAQRRPARGLACEGTSKILVASPAAR